MGLENIRIAKGGISDRVYAGYLNKDLRTWRQKKDVTDDFITAVIDRWCGYAETFTSSNGKKYEIAVKEIKLPANKRDRDAAPKG